MEMKIIRLRGNKETRVKGKENDIEILIEIKRDRV